MNIFLSRPTKVGSDYEAAYQLFEKFLDTQGFTLKRLGDERTAGLLRTFWGIRKATSLHFVEECLAFAAFLHRGPLQGGDRAHAVGHLPAPARRSIWARISSI